jgi:putative transcriptional regulator
MGRILTVLIACVATSGGAASQPGRVSELKRGVLLYAMPGLPDPNFSRTVVLLLDHGGSGSLGVVLNQPTRSDVDEVLDLKKGTSGIDLPVYWGGPVQPTAVHALIRTHWGGPRARTILNEVQLTPDLADIKQVIAEPGGRLRVRMFSGYSGWGKGQLAAEVRAGSWVIEPADAVTVFSSEPSRMWDKVRDLLHRQRA